MLQPKKVKHRKMQKGRMRGSAQSGNTVAFGEFGLQALDRCKVTARQIEAARIAMTRHVKRGGKIWIRVFPDKPITKKRPKPGWQGQGQPQEWVAIVKRAACCTKWKASPPRLHERLFVSRSQAAGPDRLRDAWGVVRTRASYET